MIKGLSLFLCALFFLFCFIPKTNAGDAFLKGGFILSPSGGTFDLNQDLSVSDKWLFSVGSDYGIGKQPIYWGFEIEFAYHSVSIPIPDEFGGGFETFREIPFNGFGNVKFKANVSDKVRIFGGAGFGINVLVVDGLDFDTDVEKKAGFQAMGGAEIGGGKRLVLEIKIQKTFSAPFGIQDFPTRTIFYAGFGF